LHFPGICPKIPAMKRDDFDTLLDLAFEEDLGDRGDLTSQAIFGDERSAALLSSKDTGVLAGMDCFVRVYARLDPEVRVSALLEEGASLSPGDPVARIEGRTLSLLSGERIAINVLAFLSGIATATRSYVEAAARNGRAVILDTRKTLPGYRRLSKYAVSVGGGRNHRMGLHDMVLIKDNHIDAAGSITAAVGRVRTRWGDRFRIEVECRNAEEVEEALSAGVDIIMLDNMSVSATREALALGKGRVLFESSGDMTREKVAEYAATGVDYISVGRLTHSVKAFDFSLRVVKGGSPADNLV